MRLRSLCRGQPPPAAAPAQVSVVQGDGDVSRAQQHVKRYACDANCFLEVRRKVVRAEGKPFADVMARARRPAPRQRASARSVQ